MCTSCKKRRPACQKISWRSLNQIFSLPVLLFSKYWLVIRRKEDLLLGVVDEPMSTSCFSQPTSFCPKPLGWCACVPPGGTRAGEFTYGNRQRSTLPHTASKANQGSRATWISVSKEASRGFRGRRRLPLVLLQFFPSGPEPFSRTPREIHIATHRQGATKRHAAKKGQV